MSIKHDGLRNAIDNAYENGFIVYREHRGAVDGHDRHMTKLIIVDLQTDNDNEEFMCETWDVQQQIELITQSTTR